MSPFEPGCVVLNRGNNPNYGLCFKLGPREEYCAPYGELKWAWFTDKADLVIVFSTHRVILNGKNLQQLVSQLAQQRVMEIRTCSRHELFSQERETAGSALVESIQIEERESD